MQEDRRVSYRAINFRKRNAVKAEVRSKNEKRKVQLALFERDSEGLGRVRLIQHEFSWGAKIEDQEAGENFVQGKK